MTLSHFSILICFYVVAMVCSSAYWFQHYELHLEAPPCEYNYSHPLVHKTESHNVNPRLIIN